MPDEVYLDPIVLPVNCDQAAPGIVMETIAQFKMLSDPAPHIVVGLSNLSQGASERSLINKSFLVMAMAAGLDASIHDPLDDELMNATPMMPGMDAAMRDAATESENA